jgi:hypothetical protein
VSSNRTIYTLVDELLGRWLELRDQGQDVPAADLCREHPELCAELERRIGACRRVEALGSDALSYTPAIPGYEILRELGRGGMGVVYLANHTQLRRPVALKMILSGAYANAAELRRFRTEAETVARLQHPNIVQIFEIEEWEGRPYFCLEYVSGGNLERKLAERRFPLAETMALVEQLARAVHAVHLCSIVHRDLKPANILITDKGVPKITDFGLAKKLDGETALTPSGAVLGTPSYMAPEQAGNSKQVGPAADVYALGAILYEMITRRPPFLAATPLETIVQVLNDEVVPPSRWCPDLPRDLETICQKCLEKDPGNRYPTAADLADDLQRCRENQRIQAQPTTMAQLWGKWIKQHPWTTAVTGLCGLLLLLAVPVLYGTWQQAEAELRLERQVREQFVAALESGQLSQPVFSVSPDSQWLALLEDGNGVTVRHVSRGDQTAIRAPVSSRAAAFNPEGTALALCTSQQGRITLFSPTTGKETQLVGEHGCVIPCLAFHPNGKQVATGGTDHTIRLWDLTAANQSRTLGGHTAPIDRLIYDRDGQRLISSSAREVIVWNSATGELLHSFPHADKSADKKP